MDNKTALAMARAIRKHYTVDDGGGPVIKWAGYDSIPFMAYNELRFQRVLNFLALDARSVEFQNAEGEYNPHDLEVMKYLLSLNRWGYQDERFMQDVTRHHEQGRQVNLAVILPEIEENRKEAAAVIAFMERNSGIYDACFRIEKNCAHYESPADQQTLIEEGERFGVRNAVLFTEMHKDSKVVAAQTEVLQKLAALSDRYIDIVKKAHEAKCPELFMRVGDGVADLGFRLDNGTSLPKRFHNFMSYSGLPHRVEDLLMEPAPAGNYLTTLFMEAVEAKDPKNETGVWTTYSNERQFVEGREIAEYQPKGQVRGQSFDVSLANAKASANAAIDKMADTLDRFERGLAEQIEAERSFRAKLSEQRAGGSTPYRGGESTKPEARDGDWADSV